jgi:hypothetical protein
VVAPARSGEGGRRTLEADAGQPVQSGDLDQRPDLRLGPADEQRPAANPQAAGEHGEVEHERCVGERKLGEVDDDVGLGANRPRESSAAEALR